MTNNADEIYKNFRNRFPETMTFLEIAGQLEQMDPHDAEKYDSFFCYVLYESICLNRLFFDQSYFDILSGSDLYKAFKRRVSNLPHHIFYDAWCAFVEGRRTQVRDYIHKYIQTYANETTPCGPDDVVSGVLFGFKNAYEGFWKYVKSEIDKIPHKPAATQLCDAIELFYSAQSDEEALEVLIAEYQKYPDSLTINELLGVAYYDGKQYGNAIAAFERLYTEETDSYDVLFYSQDMVCFFLGYASDKLKNRKEAIAYYEKAVDIDPQCPYAANNLGYLYYRERQYDKAYAILKRCIDEKLEKDIVYPVRNFARLLYVMGKYREAKEFIKTAPARVPKAIRDKIEKAPAKDIARRPSPDTIDEVELTPDSSIKTTIERKGKQFQSEKVLEDELTMRLEAGMEVFGFPLKIYRRKGEYGRQYIFPLGRLDILAEDPEGNLYIIELKKDSGYDDAYKQTVKYIDWFQKHKANGKKVYGIICLNAPNKSLVETVRKDERVKLFEYQISYSEIK